MKRYLYHGSTSIVEKPVFGFGQVHNDYGLGFYCTSREALAREWAARKNGVGYVNVYLLRDDNLKILDLTQPPYSDVIYWVALLMHNRTISEQLKTKYSRELEYLEKNFLIDVSKYDAVIGYRADDSYFQFPESFVKSEITYESLQNIFEAGELGRQYVLISERAFRLIEFKESYEVEGEYHQSYYSRKEKADHVYKELLEKDRYSMKRRLRDEVMDHE